MRRELGLRGMARTRKSPLVEVKKAAETAPQPLDASSEFHQKPNEADAENAEEDARVVDELYDVEPAPQILVRNPPRSPREKFHSFWNIINAIFVRSVFVAISLGFLYFVICIRNNLLYTIFILLPMIVVLDGIYVVFWREGMDYYWFSISFFVYMLTNCSYIIIILQFKYNVSDIACETNKTNLENIPSCSGLNITVCRLDELMVSIFMISLVIGRFLLPSSKNMSREAKFQQVLGFMASAADAVDFSNYFQDHALSGEYTLIVIIQVIFVFNVLQFGFSLKATKIRNMMLSGPLNLLDIMFSTECWSLLLIVVTQDLPCFVVRVYLWANFSSSSADLYFFTVRNFMMILIQVYHTGFLISKELKKQREVRPRDDHEAIKQS